MTNSSQAIPLTLNSRQILIVPLPDGAKYPTINRLDNEERDWLVYYTEDDPENIIHLQLPPGRYNLLFLSSQATEEDAKGLVDSSVDEFGISFASLLSSLGVTGSAAVLEKVNV